MPHAAAKATEAAAPEATEAATPAASARCMAGTPTYGYACDKLAQRDPEGEPMLDVRRREFITLLGGAAAAWPLAARAQQRERVGGLACSRTWPQTIRISAPRGRVCAGLAELGWIDGRNVPNRIPLRSGQHRAFRDYAAELISLRPDVILVSSGSTLAAVQKTTRTVPIVFVNFSDPVGAGYVATLRGRAPTQPVLPCSSTVWGGKWLELLRTVGARRDASGRHSRPLYNFRYWPIRRNPGRGPRHSGWS